MTPAETAAAQGAGKDIRLAPAALKDSPQRWGLMILLVVAMLFCYAQRNALNVAATSMSDDLGFNPAKMGVLFSAFFWVYAFMQVPSGWLVDRFGVRRAYAVGFTFWSLISVMTGLTNGLVTLILLRVLVGTGQAVAFPASARHRRLVSGSRTRPRYRILSGRSQNRRRADLGLRRVVLDPLRLALVFRRGRRGVAGLGRALIRNSTFPHKKWKKMNTLSVQANEIYKSFCGEVDHESTEHCFDYSSIIGISRCSGDEWAGTERGKTARLQNGLRLTDQSRPDGRGPGHRG